MRITTAAQAAERDASAIASGIDSWSLMLEAGSAAAEYILNFSSRYEHRAFSIFAGPGNNGGDAYVVAAILLDAGECVQMYEVGKPKSNDAQRALTKYEIALDLVDDEEYWHELDVPYHRIIVDGLLGTGQSGPLRPALREVTDRINNVKVPHTVIALDVPTGVNATTGEIVDGAIKADITLSFGTMKRAHVLQRAHCGAVAVLDIGLGEHADADDGAWMLADKTMLHSRVPQIAWNAHKGTRGRVGIFGGGPGMAGAATLAAGAALHSGAGLVHGFVHPDSILPLQIASPQAIAHPWNERPEDMHAFLLGPGLGRTKVSEQAFEDILGVLPDCPLVLDADALWMFGADLNRLFALSVNRKIVCTPHVGEFARLIGEPVGATLEERIDQAREFVRATGTTLLLKGTPTIIVAPDSNTPLVVARGNAALATGGSGDMLSGIIGTLLAQGAAPSHAAAIGAWVHGRAAEIAVRNAGGIRGVTLQAVTRCMAAAWRSLSAGSSSWPVLSSLPSVGWSS